jgi:PadR family transcriptional regulator PadR
MVNFTNNTGLCIFLLTISYYYIIFNSVETLLVKQTNREDEATLNNQYKKGVLELCILSLLKKSDRYGYEVSEALSGRIDIADGTVYPILRKLKSDGLVTTYLSEESGGPPRKYYCLTRLGLEEYTNAKNEWLQFVKAVNDLIKEEDFQ